MENIIKNSECRIFSCNKKIYERFSRLPINYFEGHTILYWSWELCKPMIRNEGEEEDERNGIEECNERKVSWKEIGANATKYRRKKALSRVSPSGGGGGGLSKDLEYSSFSFRPRLMKLKREDVFHWRLPRVSLIFFSRPTNPATLF